MSEYTDRREAWHWLKADMHAGNGRERAWKIGEERTHKAVWLSICVRGYHSSPTPFDGLEYAPGPMLCLVEIAGIGERGEHTDKDVSRVRKLIRVVNVEKELRLFAADCAERALLREREHGREPDPRSWSAIEAARSFAKGLITTEELAAARDAAKDAAKDAAWDAAKDAARDAARDAAKDAAWAAEKDAARDAARDAAKDAAWAAERAWQRDHFNEIMAAVSAPAIGAI